jgi:hypothetical protein
MVSTTQNSSARTGSVGDPSVASPSYSGPLGGPDKTDRTMANRAGKSSKNDKNDETLVEFVDEIGRAHV